MGGPSPEEILYLTLAAAWNFPPPLPGSCCYQGCPFPPPFGSLSVKGLHWHRGNSPPLGTSLSIMSSEKLPTAPLTHESGLSQVVLIAKERRTWGGVSGSPCCHNLFPHPHCLPAPETLPGPPHSAPAVGDSGQPLTELPAECLLILTEVFVHSKIHNY